LGTQMLLGILIQAKDRASMTMNNVERSMKDMGGASEVAATKFQAAARSFKAGLKIFSAGAIIVAGFTVAAEAAGDFQGAMSEVSTLVDTSSTDMGFLNDAVKDLSKQYGASPVGTAKALYQTISAGVSDASEAMQLLDIANRTAIGGVTDVQTAVDGLTSLMNAYGLSVADAETLSDQMFLGMKAGKTTIAEISGVLGRVAPTASEFNVTTAEMIAGLSALTKTGMKTTQAATRLNGIFSQLTHVTTEGKKAWAEMTAGTEHAGKAFDVTTFKSMGLTKFLAMVRDVTGGSTAELTKLFSSQEALQGILPLVGSQFESFSQIVGDMATPFGATTEAYDKMSTTWNQKTKELSASFKVAMIEIGDAVMPILQPILEGITGFLRLLSALVAHPVGKWIAGITVSLGLLLIVIGLTKMAVGGLRMAMFFLSLQMGGLVTGIKTFALILGLMAKGFIAGTIAAWNLAAALFANPITWIVLGIVALIAGIVLLIKHWDVVKKAFIVFFKATWKGIKAIGKFIVDVFKKAWGTVLGIIKGVFNKIKSIWSGITGFFERLWQGVVDFAEGIWVGFINILKGIVNKIIDVFNAMIDGINIVPGINISNIQKIEYSQTGAQKRAAREGGFATGFEVTRGGLMPFEPIHQGEVLVSSDNTQAISGFAEEVRRGDISSQLVDAVMAASAQKQAAVAEATPAAVGGGTNYNFGSGSITIAFPGITEASEVDAAEILDKLEVALEARARRNFEGTYRGLYRPDVGGGGRSRG